MPETTSPAAPAAPAKPQKSLFDLAPVPPFIQSQISAEEKAAEEIARQEGAAVLADPERWARFLEAREKRLNVLQKVAIRQTHAYDWTGYKDKDDRVVYVPRDSGLVRIRQWLGVSIGNYRPMDDRGSPSARVYKDTRPDGTEVDVVEMTADGYCNLTGQWILGITHAIRSDDEFIGRERKDGAKSPGEEFVSLQDMKASCRTGLDAKITRLLSGLRKVPEEVLVECGIKVEKAHRGRGFGTSSDRAAGRVAEEGVAAGVAKLKEEVLRRVGGEVAAVKQVTVDITRSDRFKGFDSLDRVTQGWQLENAWKALKAHPIFGDQHQPQGDSQGSGGQGGPAAPPPGKRP